MICRAWRACSSARAGVAGAQVDLRERGDRLGRIVVATDLERDRERMLQVLDRPLGLAEQEVEPAEVVQEPADVGAVGELLVLRLCLLGIRAREHPVAVALGEHRGLEVRLPERPAVLHRVGELERALDVLARCLEVALPAVAARAPREDREPELVARHARPLGERERLVEERDRRGDALQQAAADADPVEHLGAIDVGELGALDERRAPRRAARAPVLTSPVWASAMPSPFSTRTWSSTAPVPRTAGSARAYSSTASSNRCSSSSASARARIVSARARSSAETPLRRNEASTPSRTASQSTVSSGGLRLAALDLGDVLLREAVAGELALGEAGRHAKLAQALSEPRGARNARGE